MSREAGYHISLPPLCARQGRFPEVAQRGRRVRCGSLGSALGTVDVNVDRRIDMVELCEDARRMLRALVRR